MQPVRPAAGGQPGMPAGMPSVPFQLLQNINALSELSGIPVQALSNPSMQLAAQQLVAQRLVQQQMQQQMLAGQLRPAQLLALQQAQLQQRLAAGGAASTQPAAKKGVAARKRGPRGGGAASAAAAVHAAPVQPARPANPLADPGGRVVWAKVGSYPWWPAKTLDPARDPSFPPDADPPRPTSIPIRFFGTHEFQWIGSKRQLAEWAEGVEQYSRECDQAAFKTAIAEVERYRSGGRLPDVFYAAPEPDRPKAKARGKKRPAGARGADGADGTAAAAGAAGGKGRPAPRAAEPAPDRAALVAQRKKARLQALGLAPPDDSPYVGGRFAPNPNLLQLKPEWQELLPGAAAEHQQQLAAAAARRQAIAAAKRAAEQEARAIAAAAAAAAAPAPAPAGGAAQPNVAQVQAQMALMQQFIMQQQGAALRSAK